MAISPLEMNGAITRTQDYTTVKHNEDNKSMLDQSNIQTQFHKEVDVKTTQVHHAEDTENPKQKYDAKEKGHGQYEGDGGQKKKSTKEETEGRVIIKGQTSFDIKI
ncbi:MAG: hypothetical protein RRX92_00730 [Lachnospiraceae bacterium]